MRGRFSPTATIQMIYILPGMGADSGMYPGPWQTLPGARFIEWPAYQGEHSLEEVARKIVARYDIPKGAIVVGSSLGGMVGCEIAKIRPLERLVLVGSAKNKEEVSDLLRMFQPLVDLAPLTLIQQASGKIPTEITRMFSHAEADFVRAMCRAIFSWRGVDGLNVQMRRVHGRNDRVIPLPADVDLVLKGGHLIAMTHPQDCVDFITTDLA